MRKILEKAVVVGNAASRTLGMGAHPTERWRFYGESSAWWNMLFEGGYQFLNPPPKILANGDVKQTPNRGSSATPLTHGVLLHSDWDHASDVHVPYECRVPIYDCKHRFQKVYLSMVRRLTRSIFPRTFQRLGSGRLPFTTINPVRCYRRLRNTHGPVARVILVQPRS